jgi:phosphoglycerate dehydrogenase-like enzyme
MSNIIYLGPVDALTTARRILEPSFEVIAPETTREAVATQLIDAVAVVDASMKVKFDRGMLYGARQLKVISTATTGADHIDAKAAVDLGIVLLTLAGEKEILHNLTPAAELSWALLMACARRLRGAVRHVLEGQWSREEFPGIMLKGKVLGIIGCGRIGCWMARYAHAFGMEVIGYDPYVAEPQHIDKVDLDSLLSMADFISIHVPLNEHTRGMIGLREFARMKPDAIFINTSRGAITDESALLHSLLEGKLAAAGLDVLEGEPKISDHPLVQYARTHDNLILTPHMGGFSPDAVKTVVAHASKRVLNALNVPV